MWYTYNSENTICLGFSECQEISEELCAPCVSGQPACIVEEDLPPYPPPTPSPDTEKFVMVIGGGRIPDGWTSDVELVSLDDNPVPDCLTNLNPFPYGAINNGAGAAITTALESGTPLICGGCIGSATSCNHSKKCYKYDPMADTWFESGTMSEPKDYPASDYTDSFGLAMAHEGDPLEVTRDGVTFEILPNSDYPNEAVSNFDSGCMVILDDESLFLAGGGRYGSTFAYVYNKTTNAWREVSNMAEPRKDHSCGLVQSYFGPEVVVVGGNQGETSSFEIFSLESEAWRPGYDLSFRLSFADDIRVDDTFAMVGGIRGTAETSDSIIKYLPDSGTFVELPGKLKIPRYETTAILVDRSIFPSCA